MHLYQYQRGHSPMRNHKLRLCEYPYTYAYSFIYDCHICLTIIDCSGKLVECSVLGLNYNESKGAGGLFRDKIVGTNTYKNYINKIKKGTYSTGVGYVLTHPKSENADLYYSLHSCTYTTTKSGSTYKVAVYDFYDFALMNYDSLFTGIVNNWAWLCQHTWVLHKIHVNISFSA